MTINAKIVEIQPLNRTQVVVTAILQDDVANAYRRLVFRAETDANHTALAATQWDDAVQDSTIERGWYALEQTATDELFDEVIFTVFKALLQDATLAQITSAGFNRLREKPLQQALYAKLLAAMTAATAAERNAFIALALTVAYGKIGQR